MHNGDQTVLHQALWADPGEFKDEPLFVLVHEEGSVGLVTLDYVRDLMQQVEDGDREFDSLYDELYVKIPGFSGLERVMSLTGKPDELKLTITGATSVEWTCDL
jgi:hypothetical protein